MKIMITNPKFPWHEEFKNRVFDVAMDSYNPNHHQYPVMTQYGRTWFDNDAVTIIE